jgi:hypothetical protein
LRVVFLSDDNIFFCCHLEIFGSLKWAKSEEKAVYIAERKALDEKDEKVYTYFGI